MNSHSKHNQHSRAKSIAWRLVIALVALSLARIASAQDDGTLKFKGGIGVIPVTGVNAATGAVNLNVVRAVNPAGPWRIADLNATIESTGHIVVKGKGLLLAAGNGIGTNAAASVHATLFCGPAATASAFDEPGVALAANGDFVIDDFLTGSTPLPVACDNPVLLIRSGKVAGAGVWFAAGIQKLDTDSEK